MEPYLNLKNAGADSKVVPDIFVGLRYKSHGVGELKQTGQSLKNLKGLTREDLDTESLGVLTSALDLPQHVSTGNSITL